jgi:hypothetical protein
MFIYFFKVVLYYDSNLISIAGAERWRRSCLYVHGGELKWVVVDKKMIPAPRYHSQLGYQVTLA